jgi:hypothetical protein
MGKLVLLKGEGSNGRMRRSPFVFVANERPENVAINVMHD